jgi:hypothetical protein
LEIGLAGGGKVTAKQYGPYYVTYVTLFALLDHKYEKFSMFELFFNYLKK